MSLVRYRLPGKLIGERYRPEWLHQAQDTGRALALWDSNAPLPTG